MARSRSNSATAVRLLRIFLASDFVMGHAVFMMSSDETKYCKSEPK